MVLKLDGNSEIGAHVLIFAELRVMGGSEVLMAPQFGNKHGTLAIEPVSTRLDTQTERQSDRKAERQRISTASLHRTCLNQVRYTDRETENKQGTLAIEPVPTRLDTQTGRQRISKALWP